MPSATGADRAAVQREAPAAGSAVTALGNGNEPRQPEAASGARVAALLRVAFLAVAFLRGAAFLAVAFLRGAAFFRVAAVFRVAAAFPVAALRAGFRDAVPAPNAFWICSTQPSTSFSTSI